MRVFIRVTATLLLAAVLAGSGCAPSLRAKMQRIAGKDAFSIAGFELARIPAGAVSGRARPLTPEEVLEYFALNREMDALETRTGQVRAGMASDQMDELNGRLAAVEARRNALRPGVEETLTMQIHETLKEAGIFSSIGAMEVYWPPVSFQLAEPPRNLAVSPRDRIALLDTVMLRQDLSEAQVESIESRTEALGVSSVVLELGGFGGTYPTFVDDGADLEFTIETAIHEWLHQYLAFKPLGFLYVLDGLGIRHDPDIVTMNETVADLAGKELARSLLGRYYPGRVAPEAPAQPGGFSFDQEMRNTRKKVDALLAQGQVAEAEAFMEQERQFLLSKGYYIRRLNQAYFAFNDQYADTPASVNPIGPELEQLRARSASVGSFLTAASGLTSRRELQAIITK